MKAALILGYLLVAGGVGSLLFKALARSDFFQIAAIEIKGSSRLSKNDILELSGIDIHSNLVGLNRRKHREMLEEHNWIKKADIDTEWSGRLTIRIEERKPLALVNVNGFLHYVDGSGDVFARVRPGDEMDFPVISGHPSGEIPGQQDSPPLGEALLLIKYAGNAKSSSLPLQNISEINISNGELEVFLMDKPFPIHLGRGGIYEKYLRLSKVLNRLYKQKEFKGVSYIVVDYADDKVLVGRETG